MFSAGLLHVLRQVLYIFVGLHFAIDLQMIQMQAAAQESIINMLLAGRSSTSSSSSGIPSTPCSQHRSISRESVVRLQNLCSDKFLRVKPNRRNWKKTKVMADGKRTIDLIDESLVNAQRYVLQELWIRREFTVDNCREMGLINLEKHEKLVEYQPLHHSFNGAYLCLNRSGKPFLRWKQVMPMNITEAGGGRTPTESVTMTTSSDAAWKRIDLAARDSFHESNCVFAERFCPRNGTLMVKLRIPKKLRKLRKSRRKRRRRRHRGRHVAFCGSGKPKSVVIRQARRARRNRSRRRELRERRRLRLRLRNVRMRTNRRTKRYASYRRSCRCKNSNLGMVSHCGENESSSDANGTWFQLSDAQFHYHYLLKCIQEPGGRVCQYIERELRRVPYALADYDPRTHFRPTEKLKFILSRLNVTVSSRKSNP